MRATSWLPPEMPNGSFSSSSTTSVVILLMMVEPDTGVPWTLVERGFESGLFRPVGGESGTPAQPYQPAKLR
jgi:hypothetical protein